MVDGLSANFARPIGRLLADADAIWGRAVLVANEVGQFGPERVKGQACHLPGEEIGRRTTLDVKSTLLLNSAGCPLALSVAARDWSSLA